MGRGKRKTLDQQLTSVQNEIEACEVRLNSLHQEYQDILQLKKETELTALYELIQQHGLTIDDISGMIQEGHPDENIA